MPFEVKKLDKYEQGGVLDPQVEDFLNLIIQMNVPPFESMTPSEARESAIEGCKSMNFPREEVSCIENFKIPGPDCEIRLRMYSPFGDEPFPAVLYFHGGGWVFDNLDTHDHVCRSLCKGAECVVISVDYRLAPENKFPAAVVDCYEATKWVSENSEAIKVDPLRIAVGGDSAGANLATAVSLTARDSGKPAVSFQLLVCPVTDLSTFDRDSCKRYANGYFLTLSQMKWFKELYVEKPDDAYDPRVSPLLAYDLTGLPASLIITAEFDLLRDEGEKYAQRLQSCGVPVQCSRYNGMIHDFFLLLGLVDRARDAMDEACNSLRNALFA
jgi:acetyl esterase